MTAMEFINKYIGVGIDYDNAYNDQCVDEYDQYCKEVIGCPVILVNGAVNIWDNYPADYFNKIPNTPDGYPQLGDVMIWGTGIGPFGHVAIVRDGNVNSFNSLDQNWNGIQHCEIITHNYTAVLGWLRPKANEIPVPPVPQPVLPVSTETPLNIDTSVIPQPTVVTPVSTTVTVDTTQPILTQPEPVIPSISVPIIPNASLDVNTSFWHKLIVFIKAIFTK